MAKPYSNIQFGNKYRRYYYNRMLPFVKSTKASAYMMVTLSFFTVSFFGFFAVRPTVRTIVELQKQIDDSKRIKDVLQKKIDGLVEAQDQYQLIRDFVPVLDEALPATPNLSRLILTLDRMALEREATISQLKVQSIQYQPERTVSKKLPTELKPVRFQIIVSGSYEQINIFLNRLFHTRRILTADALELLPNVEQNTAQLSLTLSLKGFYQQ